MRNFFPNSEKLQWVLVDPAPFSAKRTPSIDIRQEFFTDKMAEEFAGRNALFISDIRSADWQIISDEEVEKEVNLNNFYFQKHRSKTICERKRNGWK